MIFFQYSILIVVALVIVFILIEWLFEFSGLGNIKKFFNNIFKSIAPRFNIEIGSVLSEQTKKDLEYLYILLKTKRNFTKQVKIDFYPSNKKSIENALKNLQEYCDLKSVSIKMNYNELEKSYSLSNPDSGVDIPGKTYFLYIGNSPIYTIYINPKYLGYPLITLATLAHELAHIYAHSKNISFKSPDSSRGDYEYNEKMTDLLAITLGMGKFIDEGCEYNISVDNYQIKGQVGYLTPDVLHWTYRFWNKEYINNKKTIICYKCNQKMRVPKNKRIVEVVCPNCKNTFKYNQNKLSNILEAVQNRFKS